jgi:hypothetical protein
MRKAKYLPMNIKNTITIYLKHDAVPLGFPTYPEL